MTYYRIHEALNAGQQSTLGAGEILYKSLNLLVPNFYILIAIISFFYICTIFSLIRNNLQIKQYWFAVLILLINPYLFLVHLSSIRQTIAICFFIIAVYFVTKGKSILYFLFVAVAVGFHQSAIILLPIYFLLNKRKINVLKAIIILGSVLLLLISPLFDNIIKWVLPYFPINYQFYFDQSMHNSLRSTLLSSFFFWLILFNINKLNEKELIFGKLSLISSILSILAYRDSMLTRIGMYFDVFLIITLPTIFYKMKKGKLRIFLFAVMLVIFIIRYWAFFNNDIWKEYYSNYQTILNN